MGGGVIKGQPMGNRTGFFNPLPYLATSGLAALRTAPRFLKAFGPAAARGFKAARAYKPASQNLGFLGRAKDLFLPSRGLGAPMAGGAEGLGFRAGSLLRSNPGSAFLLAGQIKNTPEILEGAYNIGKGTVQGAANYLLGTEFGKEKPDLDVGQRGSTVGQRGKTPDTINQTTEKGNQFNEDGSKKETSVSRLLKAVEKRSRDAAGPNAFKNLGAVLNAAKPDVARYGRGLKNPVLFPIGCPLITPPPIVPPPAFGSLMPSIIPSLTAPPILNIGLFNGFILPHYYLWFRKYPSGPNTCLLYTSPSPRDGLLSRMPSSA